MILKNNSQKGFTLVELAIVLMIIGLLIGGVLRGQELLKNAKIDATVKQAQSYQAAETTFVDIYHNIPGDYVNPGSTIPNCDSSPCNLPGNGDTWLNSAQEYMNFWLHMAKAHLISGIDETVTATGAAGQLATAPAAAMGGWFRSASYTVAWSGKHESNVLLLSSLGHAGSDATGNIFTPRVAAQFDRKMDDGNPNSGSVTVMHWGTTATTDDATTCEDGTKYNETLDANLCGLDILLQQ